MKIGFLCFYNEIGWQVDDCSFIIHSPNTRFGVLAHVYTPSRDTGSVASRAIFLQEHSKVQTVLLSFLQIISSLFFYIS